jgi:hypothetical protein
VNKSSKNKEFFDTLNIYAYKNWNEMGSNIDAEHIAYTPNPLYEKEENTTNKIYLTTEILNTDELKNAAVRELGHIFDRYFAKSDPELYDKIREYQAPVEDIFSHEFEYEYYVLLDKYFKQEHLSDSEEFREAWRKDLNIAFQGKSKTENDKLCEKLWYFSPTRFGSVYDFDDKKLHDIVLEDGIDDKEIDYGDQAREEIFAQLFAYAMGTCENRKDKRLILNTYKNAYEIVKKYISEYLGTNSDEAYIPQMSNLDFNA